MVDKSYIGKEWQLSPVPVEAGRIRAFASAIGAPEPLYSNEQAALDAGYRGVLAPPTFCLTLEIERLDPIRMMSELDVDIATILHGEQRYKYYLPVCAGDVINSQVRVKDVYEKKKGAMTFIEVDTFLYNQEQVLVAEMFRIIIVMNQ